MSNQTSDLSELLNDDSFIRWVKDDKRLSNSEKEKWDKWCSSNEKNQQIVKQAQKIIEMPLKEIDTKGQESKELHRLKEALKRERNKSED